MATRTTTTRTTRTGLASSADQGGPYSPGGGPPRFATLVQAYVDCRRHKRNSASAVAFEAELERNLLSLHAELLARVYRPGPTICFVVTRPKPREVWAAQFRDRVVHHLLYNHIAPRFHAAFIADSCACIPGRGTLYAAQRLEHHVRSATGNWARPAHYLKCDLANFFVGIDKHVLRAQLVHRIDAQAEPWWLWLAATILMHDPRPDAIVHSPPALLRLVPPHKSLFNAPADHGLPIGNLSSQFFANVHLDALDQRVKHRLHMRHYVRYVDDFLLLHEEPAVLVAALQDLSAWLPLALHAHLNPRKTILQPVARGVDFVGQVVKPWRRETRRGTVRRAVARLEDLPAEQLHTVGNSYLGLVRQASACHTDQAAIARALLKRGRTVDGALTKSFRPRDTAHGGAS